ncbi:MAG: Crp/Fnr family transcriptional regulator [Anaerolineae bacterium]|nr:Crp/Fnr family transcriptional regulator [Anaerolineae bacterium]
MQTLLNAPLFNGLTESEGLEAARYIALTRYDQHQYLFHTGDPADCIYILRSGMVKVTYGNPRGDETIVSIFQQWDVFGELFLGQYRFRVGSAVTLNEVIVGKITESNFWAMLERLPKLSQNFIKHLADAQRRSLARTHALMHTDARSRLLGTLLNLARHFCCLNDDWLSVPEGITQTDIASMACLNRTTVSLLINDLRRQGILGGHGRTLTINHRAVVACLEEVGLEILE